MAFDHRPCHERAHGPADDDSLTQVMLLQQRVHCIRRGLDGAKPSVRAVTVAGQVRRQNECLATERLQLRGEEPAVAGPTVQQYQRTCVTAQASCTPHVKRAVLVHRRDLSRPTIPSGKK